MTISQQRQDFQAQVQQARPAPLSGIEFLLKVESDVRRVHTPDELAFLLANETVKLTRAGQIYVFVGSTNRQCVKAVSSVSKVERDAPRIRWIESVIAGLEKDAGLEAKREFSLPAYCKPGEEEHKLFPYRFFVWLPLKLRDGHVFGGILVTRDRPLSEGEAIVLTRLAETASHAWTALAGEGRLKRQIRMKPILAGCLVAITAAGFLPVPMSVLAPAEVVPVNPHIIAAPMDGVIESIEVEPNAAVGMSDILLRFNDTTLRNQLLIAEQEVSVAEARLKQISQGAINDPKMRGDLAVAGSELALASAKRKYAEELLARTNVGASASGVAIYSDKRDWIGKPVSTGERLMEIADPTRMQIRIDVPVADAIAVQAGAEVRAFLDSDPLHPVEAKVVSASFEAQQIETGVLAYRVYATLSGSTMPTGMRLGIHGTAQIFGKKVPLALYVFRRPIAAIRQRLGF